MIRKRLAPIIGQKPEQGVCSKLGAFGDLYHDACLLLGGWISGLDFEQLSTPLPAFSGAQIWWLLQPNPMRNATCAKKHLKLSAIFPYKSSTYMPRVANASRQNSQDPIPGRGPWDQYIDR